MLEVRFVEATRQAGRELGVQWNVFGQRTLANIGNRTPSDQLPVTNSGGSPFSQPGVTAGGTNVGTQALGISPVVVAGVLSGTAPFGVIVASCWRPVSRPTSSSTRSSRRAWPARWPSRTSWRSRATPRASSPAANIPIPVPGALGQVTIDYKRYGVGLAFTPTVLSGGLINLKIEPEVSQLDISRIRCRSAGISVPPLIVRRASTTVELRDGQSFVIGGLLQSDGQNAISQLPWLGDVPVLGALFRSASYQKNETDLAIIVTPRLVRPARPGDVDQDAARHARCRPTTSTCS